MKLYRCGMYNLTYIQFQYTISTITQINKLIKKEYV